MLMLLFASMKSIDLKLSIINYSLFFIFVIESSYSLLSSEVSNIELFSTFFVIDFQPCTEVIKKAKEQKRAYTKNTVRNLTRKA